MNIELMKIEDFDTVYDLWMHTPGMGLHDIEDCKEGIERYLKRNPTTCFVAKEEGKVIGVAMGGHDGRRGYIYHTTVEVKHRSKGIGKGLIDCVIEALKEEGIYRVALLAFKNNELGNSFWKTYGFAVREDVNYYDKVIVKPNQLGI